MEDTTCAHERGEGSVPAHAQGSNVGSHRAAWNLGPVLCGECQAVGPGRGSGMGRNPGSHADVFSRIIGRFFTNRMILRV